MPLTWPSAPQISPHTGAPVGDRLLEGQAGENEGKGSIMMNLRRKRDLIRLGLGLLLLLFGPALPAMADDEKVCGLWEQTSYCLTDIGALLGDYSFATGINNNGEVVGNFGNGRAFLYKDGAVAKIEPLEGGNAIGVSAINNAGVIVGNSVNSDAGSDSTPVIVVSGQTMALPSLSNAIPHAINDSGQIAGAAQGMGAFVYHAGAAVSIGGEGSAAYGMNADGDVVGISENSRAFVHGSGGTVEIGALPGNSYSSGNSINDRRQVAGVSAPNGINEGQAVLYSNETGMVALGRLELGDVYSVATAINMCGQVVGFSGITPDFYATKGVRAFLYAFETMIDLNKRLADASGIFVTAASAINDHGQIAGRGSKDDHLHAVLLTPRKENEGCDTGVRQPVK